MSNLPLPAPPRGRRYHYPKYTAASDKAFDEEEMPGRVRRAFDTLMVLLVKHEKAKEEAAAAFFDAPDSVGARPLHALLVANTPAAMHLTLKLLDADPLLLLQAPLLRRDLALTSHDLALICPELARPRTNHAGLAPTCPDLPRPAPTCARLGLLSRRGRRRTRRTGRSAARACCTCSPPTSRARCSSRGCPSGSCPA